MRLSVRTGGTCSADVCSACTLCVRGRCRPWLLIAPRGQLGSALQHKNKRWALLCATELTIHRIHDPAPLPCVGPVFKHSEFILHLLCHWFGRAQVIAGYPNASQVADDCAYCPDGQAKSPDNNYALDAVCADGGECGNSAYAVNGSCRACPAGSVVLSYPLGLQKAADCQSCESAPCVCLDGRAAVETVHVMILGPCKHVC